MKRFLAIGLLLIEVISAKSFANPIIVSSIADLQKAINAANPGDIIILKKGIYTTTGDISINKTGTKEKPITIAAEDREY